MWSRLWSSGGVSILNLGHRLAKGGETVGVVHMGGFQSTAAQGSAAEAWATPASEHYVEAYLTTGATWGNSTQRANMTTAIDAVQASGWFPAGKVHLFGGSAGGVCVLQWALANPSRVQSIYLTITPPDLQSLYDRDPLSLQASIDGSYGGRPGDEDNPALRADELVDIPIAVAYSTDDPICPLAETEAFIEDAEAQPINMGAIGHNWDPTLHNASAVAGFFRASE